MLNKDILTEDISVKLQEAWKQKLTNYKMDKEIKYRSQNRGCKNKNKK